MIYIFTLLPFISGTITVSLTMIFGETFPTYAYVLMIISGVLSVLIGVISTGLVVYRRSEARLACKNYNKLLRFLKKENNNLTNEEVRIAASILNQFIKSAKEDIEKNGMFSRYYGLGIEKMRYVTIRPSIADIFGEEWR